MRIWPFLLFSTLLSAQPGSDAVFDHTRIHEVRLTLAPNDWGTLLAKVLDRTEKSYYQADAVIDGRRIARIGLRARGNGSRTPRKPGIKLDFNYYVKGQKYFGMAGLVLDNLWQDPIGIKEFLTMGVLTSEGFPAPRESFTRLNVNGHDYGIYAIVENIGESFLDRTFGSHDGYLYEYVWPDFFYRFEYPGPEASKLVPVPFKPETRLDDPDPRPLVEFIRTANQSPDERLESDLARYVNLENMVHYWAIEAFLSEVDGFFGHWGMNNFYLYRRDRSTQFQWIPWDRDMTFIEAERPIDANIGDNVLGRRLLAIPRWREFYREKLRALAARYLGEEGPLATTIREKIELLNQAILADPNKQFENWQYEYQVDALLHEFLPQRAAYLEKVLSPGYREEAK